MSENPQKINFPHVQTGLDILCINAILYISPNRSLDM